MHMKLMLSAIVLELSWRFGYSCSCRPASLKQLYCDSSFVARFHVRRELKVPGGSDDDYNAKGFYRVVMRGDPWKFPQGNATVDLKRLHTPANSGLCGVYLRRGQKYLISGNTYGGTLNINLCDSITLLGKLPKEARRLKRVPLDCTNID